MSKAFNKNPVTISQKKAADRLREDIRKNTKFTFKRGPTRMVQRQKRKATVKRSTTHRRRNKPALNRSKVHSASNFVGGGGQNKHYINEGSFVAL